MGRSPHFADYRSVTDATSLAATLRRGPEPAARRGAGPAGGQPAPDPLPRLRPQQPQPARADRADRARPHGRGRGRRDRRGDGDRGRAPPARAHRLPDPEEDHPRVDLLAAPLPDRAPGPGRRPRRVIARLGDRARHGRVGRHRARGHRRGRRRRHLGHAQLPHPRGRQEQPLPPRGAPRRDRLAARRHGRARGSRPPAAPARLRRPVGGRPPAPADPPEPSARSTGRPTRPRPSCAASAPPRATRACSTRSTGAEFHLFGVHRERGLRGVPGRDHRHPPRRHLPRHRRRRRLDHPPQAPRPLQAARRPRARAGRHRARRAGDRRAGPRADPRRAHLARDRLHRAGRRRLPGVRLLQRRHEHRPVPAAARGLPLRAQPPHDQASSCSPAAATSSRTASTST